MKQLLNMLSAALLLFAMCGCVENNISYDKQINVSEGIYISGPASEFSREVPKGRLLDAGNQVLYSLNVWLKSGAHFTISYVGEDGQPVSYGSGGSTESLSPEIKTYTLTLGGSGISVDEEGLYKVVVNRRLNEINIVPFKFKIEGNMEITGNGDKILPLSKVEYDRVNHLVTWKSGDERQVLLPA